MTYAGYVALTITVTVPNPYLVSGEAHGHRFFVNIQQIPPVLRWLRYFSTLGFTLEALAINEVGSGLQIIVCATSSYPAVVRLVLWADGMCRTI